MQEFLFYLNDSSTLMLAFYFYMLVDFANNCLVKRNPFKLAEVFEFKFTVVELTVVWFVLAAFQVWFN